MSLITPDFGLLFWMVVIFGAVFFLLAKFGFPVITRMVQKRSDHIAQALEDARKAREQLSGLAEEQKEMLEQTRREQGRILSEASATREEIISQAAQAARAEADSILERAREEIRQEKEAAIRDMRREVALVSLEVAEKVISDSLSSDAARQDFLEKAVDEALNARIN